MATKRDGKRHVTNRRSGGNGWMKGLDERVEGGRMKMKGNG
jgi:hypothetical protein